MKNHPVPSLPWTAAQWRRSTVEHILATPAFRRFIQAWQRADTTSGATVECFNRLAQAAGLDDTAPMTPLALSKLAHSAIAQIESREVADGPELFLLCSVVHSTMSVAADAFPARLRKDLTPMLDFLEGTLYRTALTEISLRLGVELPGLKSTDLLPGCANQMPTCAAPGPGGVFFSRN